MTMIEADYINIGRDDLPEPRSEIADIEQAAAEGNINVSVMRSPESTREDAPVKKDYKTVAHHAIKQILGDDALPQREPEPMTEAQEHLLTFEQGQQEKIKEDITFKFGLQIEGILGKLEEKDALEATVSRRISLKSTPANQALLKLLQEKGYVSEEMKDGSYLDLPAYIVARMLASKVLDNADKRVLVSAHSPLVKEVIEETISARINKKGRE